MKRTALFPALGLTLVVSLWMLKTDFVTNGAITSSVNADRRPMTPDPAGYFLEHDADVAKTGPAPHNGPGRSTGYNFFEKAEGFKLAFRKRVLHPGAAIGYHLQKEDEVYYVLSGTGMMQMNGAEFPVKSGDAILTRPGSSHGLKQIGKEDLVLIINYEK